jgi:hypothetical protein
MVPSPAVCGAVRMRRVSRVVNSSPSNVSSTSRIGLSPCSKRYRDIRGFERPRHAQAHKERCIRSTAEVGLCSCGLPCVSQTPRYCHKTTAAGGHAGSGGDRHAALSVCAGPCFDVEWHRCSPPGGHHGAAPRLQRGPVAWRLNYLRPRRHTGPFSEDAGNRLRVDVREDQGRFCLGHCRASVVAL